uniref:Uncharacterized protein n=1 Tax=Chelonoidis abingdonii TaxID=106734 RepID=A0A8C0GIX0_CHEAB
MQLQTLKEERRKLLGFKVTGERRSQEYLEQTKIERCKVVSEFEQLRHLLEEQERLLLTRLGEVEKEIVNWQNGSVAKLSEEISHLSELISELEKKYQQPVSEFLQDIRSTLNRCKVGDFQQPLEIFPDVEKKLSNFSQKNIVLKETLRKFKDSLPSELEVEWGECLEKSWKSDLCQVYFPTEKTMRVVAQALLAEEVSEVGQSSLLAMKEDLYRKEGRP